MARQVASHLGEFRHQAHLFLVMGEQALQTLGAFGERRWTSRASRVHSSYRDSACSYDPDWRLRLSTCPRPAH